VQGCQLTDGAPVAGQLRRRIPVTGVVARRTPLAFDAGASLALIGAE
jgi:hypothetical protein